MPNERALFWLNLTNIGLGIVVLLAVLAVVYGFVWELVLRHRVAPDLVYGRALMLVASETCAISCATHPSEYATPMAADSCKSPGEAFFSAVCDR